MALTLRSVKGSRLTNTEVDDNFLACLHAGATITEANIHTAVDNAFRQISRSGHTTTLLSFDVGGSTGPVQLDFKYDGRMQWRNKTNSTTWTGWRTIWHDGNLDPGLYAPLAGAAFTGAVSAPRLAVGYDSGVSGSVNASGWFRTSGATGLFFASYGTGVQPPTGDYGSVQTYSGLGSWPGFSIGGHTVFMGNGTNLGIYNDTSNAWVQYGDLAGTVMHFKGDVVAYSSTISDAREKTNIRRIGGALGKLLALNGVSYTLRDSGRDGIGVIAQELQQVFPEAVSDHELPRQPGSTELPERRLTVAYGQLIGPVIEALRELDLRLRAVEAG